MEIMILQIVRWVIDLFPIEKKGMLYFYDVIAATPCCVTWPSMPRISIFSVIMR